jgi:hypothetical protein
MLDIPEATLSAEDATRLQMHFAELETALASDVPAYKNIMGLIHDTLRRNPDVITFLSPDETALLIKGGERYVGQHLATKEKKLSKADRARLDEML